MIAIFYFQPTPELIKRELPEITITADSLNKPYSDIDSVILEAYENSCHE